MQRLRQGSFDGTISLEGQVHGEPPVDSFGHDLDRIPCAWPFDSPNTDALIARCAHIFCTVAKRSIRPPYPVIDVPPLLIASKARQTAQPARQPRWLPAEPRAPFKRTPNERNQSTQHADCDPQPHQ